MSDGADGIDIEAPPASSDGPTEPAPARKRKRKERKADPGRARTGRALALVGHLGLIALFLAWFTAIAPPERVPRLLPLVALVAPLLIPLRGMLHGRRYTHQWVSFYILIYFLVGVDTWANPPGEGLAWLGVLTVALSLAQFVGCVMYARYTPSPPRPPEA